MRLESYNHHMFCYESNPNIDAQIEAFSTELRAGIECGNLSFPTCFDLSLRIQRIADDPNATIDAFATAVKSEPVLSAKLLRLANSPLMNSSNRHIVDVKKAVTKVGLVTLRMLAFSVATEQLSRDVRSPHMKMLARSVWVHSIDVASWSYAFAKHLPSASSDKAMLAAMLSQIGKFYLIAFAHRCPAFEDDQELFAQFVALWDLPIRIPLLGAFRLPIPIIEASVSSLECCSQWPPKSMPDILAIANMAASTADPLGHLLGLKCDRNQIETVLGIEAKTAFDHLCEQAAAEREAIIAILSA